MKTTKLLSILENKGLCVRVNIEDVVLLTLLSAPERKLTLSKLFIIISELSQIINVDFEVHIVGSRAVARALRKLADRGLIEIREDVVALTPSGVREAESVVSKVKQYSYVCIDPNIVLYSELLLGEINRALKMYVDLPVLEAFIRRLEQLLREVYYYDTLTFDISVLAARGLRNYK